MLEVQQSASRLSGSEWRGVAGLYSTILLTESDQLLRAELAKSQQVAGAAVESQPSTSCPGDVPRQHTGAPAGAPRPPAQAVSVVRESVSQPILIRSLINVVVAAETAMV